MSVEGHPQFEAGDTVMVDSLDGDQSEAAVVEIANDTAGDYTIPTQHGERTLEEHWRGHGVSADEPVVRVRYVKGVTIDGNPASYSQTVYGIPISKVELK